jgi:sodium-dependent dicarboxylate transporter 2/3/5
MTLASAAPWHALGCLAVAAAVHAAAPPPDALRAGLALFVLIGGLWMTQALHLTVTALLVPPLAVLAGLMDLRAALASFAHPVIFLFLGSFALAAALQQQGLDRALAAAMLRVAGGRRPRAVALLFLLTAALSMWISNTATVAMMLPLALALLESSDPWHPAGAREQAFVLLGVAYSASIGGIGTLVGSPPNAIAAAQAGIGFTQWLAFGLPLVLVLLPLMAFVLHALLRPRLAGQIALTRDEPLEWTAPRRWTLAVFVLTAMGWAAGAPLAHALGVSADIDSMVALAAIVALAAGGAMGWPDVEHRAHWSVLLLFGGGLALSEAMAASGATRYLADAFVALVQGLPAWLVIVAVVAFVVFLTELVSNTASAALLVPIFMGVAPALGLPPVMLAAAIAASASCAFMLPVATPPNAIVFATEQVPQATMMRCGLVLNLVCIAVIAGLAALAFG